MAAVALYVWSRHKGLLDSMEGLRKKQSEIDGMFGQLPKTLESFEANLTTKDNEFRESLNIDDKISAVDTKVRGLKPALENMIAVKIDDVDRDKISREECLREIKHYKDRIEEFNSRLNEFEKQTDGKS